MSQHLFPNEHISLQHVTSIYCVYFIMFVCIMVFHRKFSKLFDMWTVLLITSLCSLYSGDLVWPPAELLKWILCIVMFHWQKPWQSNNLPPYQMIPQCCLSVLKGDLCKRSWNLKMSKSAPTEALFSPQKTLPWNASLVDLPLIWGLPDITLHHRVLHLHYLSLVFFCLFLLASENTGHLGGALKFRQRGNTVLQKWSVWGNQSVIGALKHVNLFQR